MLFFITGPIFVVFTVMYGCSALPIWFQGHMDIEVQGSLAFLGIPGSEKITKQYRPKDIELIICS